MFQVIAHVLLYVTTQILDVGDHHEGINYLLKALCSKNSLKIYLSYNLQ